MNKQQRPNLKTATIGEITSYCCQMNGKTRNKKMQTLIHSVLHRLTDYEKVGAMKWSVRHAALVALDDIQAIGVSESLELHNQRKVTPKSTLSRIRDVARCMGLHAYKFNGRYLITRTPLTIAPKVTMLADMPPERRGETSPELEFA